MEFPSNLGLKEPAPGHEPGVRKLPAFLKEHGLHDRLHPSFIRHLPAPPYTMQLDMESGVRNAHAIISYAREQAALGNEILAAGHLPLIIGGDCSILIGNSMALKQRGEYGLFYLDGHTDFMLPSLSQTGGAAGMDLAIVTGHGHRKLTDIDGLGPYIREANVWCVGNREYDADYVQPIIDSQVHYIDLLQLRRLGISGCVNDFLQWIEEKDLAGFLLHIDVDVLSDEIMPAVDSRSPGGLTYSEFAILLELLLPHPKLAGVEITILDPELDPGGRYVRRFINEFCKGWGASEIVNRES